MVKQISWPLPQGKQDGPFKLERMKQALQILGEPQNKLKNVIHIAGTNGKGSTMAFVEKILLESGFSTCAYISPSLIELNERLRINSQNISDELFLQNLTEVEDILKKNNIEKDLTFFEGLTATAFYTFAKIGADFNIIEVGLGGRFDATNVFAPTNKLANIITQISFDHTEYLGNTIKKIATEKVQILTNGAINILSAQNYEGAQNVFCKHIKEISAEGSEGGYIYGRDFSCEKITKKFVVESKHFDDKFIDLPRPSLLGSHQYFNASNAVFAAKMIAKKLNLQDKITDSTIAAAIASTTWLARMQKVVSTKNYDIIVDGGHNEGSVLALCNFLQETFNEDLYKKINIIYGALERKDVAKIAAKLTLYGITNFIDKIYLTAINTYDKCHLPQYLQQIFAENGLQNTQIIDNLPTFLTQINPHQKTLFLAYGSLYLCGEIIEIFLHI